METGQKEIAANFSVVIATLNRGEDLGALLLQLAEMQKVEVIVVDQTEGYPVEIQQQLEQLIKSNANFSYYKLQEKSASNARNFGVNKASGEYIFFIDDDVILPEDYFTKYFDYIQANYKVDAVAGMVLGLDKAINYSLSKIYHNKYFGHLFRPVNYAYPLTTSDLGTCNMLIKKDVFLQLAGFDTTLLRFEDSDFSTRFLKAGHISHYEPDLFLIHKLTSTGAVRNLTGLVKSEAYWEQCFYLVLKNFGLKNGRGLLYYYVKPQIISRRLVLNPLQYITGLGKLYKGYLLAKNKLNLAGASARHE
jgi:GT2 family glycosyltransferase